MHPFFGHVGLWVTMCRSFVVMSSLTLSKLKKKTPVENVCKAKKKLDRFDGLTEEEVQKFTLPDYLQTDLDIVFIGINPGLMAAYRGRYYAGPGNHFYKLLHESELTPRCLTYEEDYKLPEYGIGLTNIVERATKSSADLTHAEIKQGSEIIERKIKFYKPKIAVFNGKCIYDVFADKTDNFNFGLQTKRIGETALWVTPSSSARCANFPKMTDKLHFFTSLKKYLQFLKGEIECIDIKEFLFEGKCKQFIPRTSKMWRRKNMSAFLHGGRIANKDTICLDTSDENVAIAHSTEFVVKELQRNINNKVEETLRTDETNSFQNIDVCTSQDSVKSFFENDNYLQENSQSVNDTKTNTYEIKSNNSDKHAELNIEVKQFSTKDLANNSKKKKGVKRLSQKPARSKNLGNNTDLDFVNLIKQRLVQKAENKANEETHLENKTNKEIHL